MVRQRGPRLTAPQDTRLSGRPQIYSRKLLHRPIEFARQGRTYQ